MIFNVSHGEKCSSKKAALGAQEWLAKHKDTFIDNIKGHLICTSSFSVLFAYQAVYWV